MSLVLRPKHMGSGLIAVTLGLGAVVGGTHSRSPKSGEEERLRAVVEKQS